jgi:8-oxo-dGTP diphosphatase
VAPMLPANAPILAALALPKIYAISNVSNRTAAFLQCLDAALERGLRLIQFREKAMPETVARELLEEVLQRARRCGARVLVNSAHAFAREGIADGVHLTAADLMAAKARPAGLCAASCHDAKELAQAAKLGCDFTVLGPVAPTASHPGGQVLGWAAFADLVAGMPMPVYALGGMRQHDLAASWRHGAHGIAMMRAAW